MAQDLHRFIPDSELPVPLKRKLVFGDLEQIDALNALEADIEIKTTELAKIKSSELKYFEVRVSYSGEQYLKIFAVDAEDAKKKAKEESDMDGDYMKAISLKQPWVYAIFKLGKDIENRNWPTKYRGPLLIHASKAWDEAGYNFLTHRLDEFVPSKEHHIFGAIIGQVNLIDCVDQLDSRWFFGDYGFELEDPIEFKTPIPYRGRLGIFDVPDSIITERRQT